MTHDYSGDPRPDLSKPVEDWSDPEFEEADRRNFDPYLATYSETMDMLPYKENRALKVITECIEDEFEPEMVDVQIQIVGNRRYYSSVLESLIGHVAEEYQVPPTRILDLLYEKFTEDGE